MNYHDDAIACADVYDNHKDIGWTQYNFYTEPGAQLLTIAGTNEIGDWISNLALFSWEGVKLGAYLAARDIYHAITIDPAVPLYVRGHSLGGAAAIAFKRMYGKRDNVYCTAFAPSRSLRPWADLGMKNTTIFIDPDDIVPKLAFISFKHPICKVIKDRENHIFGSIEDHKMEHWLNVTRRYS